MNVPTTPLEALVLVFAVISVALVLLFALALSLSFIHQRRRSRIVAHLPESPDPAAKDTQRLRYWTVGDLVADTDLYHYVAENRKDLRSIYVPPFDSGHTRKNKGD